MRRFFAVLIFLFAFGGVIEAQPRKVDRAIERTIKDYKADKSGKSKSDKVRVIIQTNGDPDATGVSNDVQKKQGKILHKFGSFPGIAAELSIDEIENTAANRAIFRI